MHDDLPLILPFLVLVAGGGVLAWLAHRGAFRADVFADAPPRDAGMSLADLFMGVGVWLLGMIAGASIAVSIFGVSESTPTPTQSVVMLSCTFAGMLIAPALILLRLGMVGEGGIRRFGLAPGALPRAFTPAVVGLLVTLPVVMATSQIVSLLLISLGVQPPPIAHDTLVDIIEGSAAQRVGLIVVVVVLAPFIEEIVFRGLIQTSLRNSGLVRNPWWAIFAATIPFTAIHMGKVEHAIALPGLYVLSVGLGWVYERTGNLWACILMHGMFNATQVAIALIFFAEPASV